MAQVRKYATGGGTEKKEKTPPTLFHWDGIGDYNVEDLEKTYAAEIDNVLSQYDLDEEDKRKIRDRAYLTLQEIKSGRMGNRNANGTWVNVTPGFESTGMNEKERKWFLGRKKYVKDADFYQNLAYDVLDQMIGKTNVYTAPKDPVVTPAKITDFDFGKDLTAYYFYNKQFDPNNWDYTNAKTNISSRLAEFKKKVTDSNLSDSDKNDLLGRINQAEAALQTENPNDDYYGLVRLMNNPRRWFDKNYAPTNNSGQGTLTEEERKAQEDKKKFNEAYNARLASDKENWINNYVSWTYDPNLMVPNYSNLSPVELQSKIQWNKLNKDNYADQNLMGLFHSFISSPAIRKGLEESGYFENGWYYLPDTQDVKNNIITRVNPTTYTFERVPFTSFKAGNDYYINQIKLEIAKELGIANPWDTQAPQGYKSGGVLKAQKGLSTDYIRKAQQEYNKSDTNSKPSKQENKTINSNDLHTELSKADKYRIGAIAGDVGSLLLSMTGVGSVASALTGAGSTTANVYADTLEGKTTGEAIWNNLGSYALDAVSLLPFAKAAKIPKIVKAISQYTPKITAAIAGMQGLANADEYLASFNKLTSGEKLTVGDWRNIANGLQIVLGGTAATHRASVGKSNVEAVRSADKVWLKTDQGWKSINQDLAKKLSEAPDLKTQNELLKDIGITLTESLNWKFKGKGKNDIKTTPLYDFNKEAVRYSGNVDIYHKFGPGERALGNLNLPNINFFNKIPIRNAYNWTFHNKAYNRYKKTEAENRIIEKQSSYLQKQPDGSYINTKTGDQFVKKGDKWVKYNKGGIITKHQQGGIVKYQTPAGPMPTGVGFKSGTSWYNDVLTPMWKNILEGVKSGKFKFEDLNNMQAAHAKLYHSAGNNFINQAYQDPSVGKYQQDFINFGGNFGNNVGIANAFNVGRYITGNNPISGDNPNQKYKVDNYYSGITDDRRMLGREGDYTPEQLAQMNKDLLPFNSKMELATDGYYRIVPMEVTPPPIATAKPNNSIDTLGKGITNVIKSNNPIINERLDTGEKGGLDTPKQTNTNSNGISANAAISDLLGLGRLAGTIWTNNRIARTLKNSLSPLLIDPPQIRRQVMGDLATKTYMENLGAEANRLGSRPITSDASLQLGQALDYNNRANEYRIKGYLADKQAIDKTALAAQQAAEQNTIARTEAANRNRAAMLGIRQAKANIEAQRKSANWSQAVAPWLMDKEFRLRQNDQMLKQLDYQSQDYLSRKNLNDASAAAQQAFDTAKSNYIKAGNDESTWIGSEAYNKALADLNAARQAAADKYNQDRIKAQKAIYSSPFILFKSGGQLTYPERAALEHDKAVNKALLQDSKEFNKIIRESKKENNKLILSLSGLTKELVIKSMTYGG